MMISWVARESLSSAVGELVSALIEGDFVDLRPISLTVFYMQAGQRGGR